MDKQDEHNEFEAVDTFATVLQVDDAGWDSLGELIVLECSVGRPSREYNLAVGLVPAAAQDLLRLLSDVVPKRPITSNPQ